MTAMVHDMCVCHSPFISGLSTFLCFPSVSKGQFMLSYEEEF